VIFVRKKAKIAWIDIENSKTQKVITFEVPVLKYERTQETIFDISKLNEQDVKLLIDAINPTMKMNYTDIEMFYLDSMPRTPIFGPDFVYKIEDKKLIAKYIRGLPMNKIKEAYKEFYGKDYRKTFLGSRLPRKIKYKIQKYYSKKLN